MTSKIFQMLARTLTLPTYTKSFCGGRGDILYLLMLRSCAGGIQHVLNYLEKILFVSARVKYTVFHFFLKISKYLSKFEKSTLVVLEIVLMEKVPEEGFEKF